MPRVKTTSSKKTPNKSNVKPWTEMTPKEKEKFEAERVKMEASIRRSMHGLPTKEEWMEEHQSKFEILKVKLSGCSKRGFHKVCKHIYYVPLDEEELSGRFNQVFNPTVMIGMRTEDLMRRPPAVKEVIEYSCELCNCAIPKCKAEPEVLSFEPDDNYFY
jgi:hypothetical protein